MKKVRKLIALLMVGIMTLMLFTGCSSKTNSDSNNNNSNEETSNTEKTDNEKTDVSDNQETKKDGLTIKVIPMATESAYWIAVREGAEAAAAEFGDEWGGIEILFDGPTTSTDVQAQIDIINNSVAAGCDGLVVAPSNSTSPHDAIVSAIEQGVHVIDIDNLLEPMDADAFYGTDGVQMTSDLATYMYENVLDGEGTYVEIMPSLDMQQQVDRYDGFVNKMKEVATGMEDLGAQLTGGDVSATQDIVQNLLIGSDIDCIFSATDRCGLGVLNALNQYNLGGEIAFCTVDCNIELLQGMRQGNVQALALQMPYNQGYEAVKMILTLKSGGTVEKYGDSGSFIVTPENMDTEEAVAAIRQYISGYEPEDSK